MPDHDQIQGTVYA
jgi:hypothetical protein